MRIAAFKTSADLMLRRAFLHKMLLFDELSDEGLRELESMAQERSFRKNDLILRPQEAGRTIFFLKDGSVKLGMNDRSGREVILYILRRGDFFGEASLFNGGSQVITATALEPCETIMIARKPFMDFLEKHPDVLVKMLATLSVRLHGAEKRIGRLVFADAYEKVASVLMDALEEMQVPLRAGAEVSVALTRKELAGLVGVSRETFTRVVTAFKKAGLLRIKNRRIAVINPARLKREASRSSLV